MENSWQKQQCKSPAAPFSGGVALGRARPRTGGKPQVPPTTSHLPAHLLGLINEVVRLVPVSQEVRGLLVVHADVVIREQTREKVIDFPGDVQNVVNAAGNEERKKGELLWSRKGTARVVKSTKSDTTCAARFYLQP